MKLFGSITELVSAVFRKDTRTITLRPSQSVTYSANVDVQLAPSTDATQELVEVDANQVLTNKSISGSSNTITNVSLSTAVTGVLPTANGGTGQNSTASFPSTGTVAVVPAAGVVKSNGTVLSSSNVDLTSEVTGTLPSTNGGTGVNNAGTLTYGANNIAFTTSGATALTLPTAGTIATLSGTETLLNKTTVSSTALATGALTLPAGTEAERPGTATNGMVRYNSTSGSFEGYANAAWSGIGGGGTTDLINQVGHSFALGDVLYLNGSTYAKARADSATTAEVVGMVSRIIDANNFELTLSGEVKNLSGLTPGEVYFLSPTTAGATTITEPTVIGQISLPVGIASSTTTMYVAPKRGAVVGSSNAQTVVSLANNATSTVQDVSAYNAGELTGWVSISATTPLRFYISAQFSKNGAATNWNLSYQTSGDTPPTGFVLQITSGGIIQAVLPSITGFVSASITYSLNAPAVGTTFPLSVSTSLLVDKNKIQKKTLASTATATSGATVQLPSLTFNNLVIGKNYRLHMHGYLTCFVNATGAAFAAIHNASQLALVYYEPSLVASNRFMAAGTTQLFTAAATTVTFQFSNTTGGNGSAIAGGISWVILEELNDTDLSTAFT